MEVDVGTCSEHIGVHVYNTYNECADDPCINFLPVTNFVHKVSDTGNAFGGYSCECGEPWLDSFGGCLYLRR